MKTSLVALTAALVAFAGVAYAQQHLPPEGDPLGTATVTRAEAQAKAAEMFGKLDANGDGKLDPADREAMLAKRFDTMDTNHDGQLSKQEFIAAHQKMPMGPGMGEHGMGEHRIGQHGGGGPMGGGGVRMAAQADTNGDHAVSREAFIAAALKRFDAADTNHDGKLTPDERKAAFRAGMKRMHEQRMDHAPGHDRDAPPPPPPAPAN